MNIGTLTTTALATAAAMENIRSHTQKSIDRAYATVFFVKVNGFFEANPAVHRINVQIDAEGDIGEEGHAYTIFSLSELNVEVIPGVKQRYAYGFNDVEYHDSGQIKLVTMDALNDRLANEDLISAIKSRLLLDGGNNDWLNDYLPFSVGNPDGRGITFTVDRDQVGHVGDVLLHRLSDEHGRLVTPTPQQTQAAQDDVISWVKYQ